MKNPPATSYRLSARLLEQQYEESTLKELTSLIPANKHQTPWKDYSGFKKIGMDPLSL